MKTYDLVDEALLSAGADPVWEALVGELSGAARWWVPDNTFEPADGAPDRVGALTRITVHTKGVDKGGKKLRFTARTTAVEPGRRLGLEYVEGAFRGTAEFTLVPLDGGGTRLAMRFRARPHGGLAVLANVVDIGAQHTRATRAAFARLGRLLPAEPSPAASAATAPEVSR
ncbi:SRPBCC family protein [Streptomyces sp. NBC_01754]|uniref:SRPBCC family protein n=1 Tax=Streptomyces sp. NBC_01754 TaxID=2975930 RepID=UPI002DDC6EB5|nr:SRPBCC family protein [Streptomyces sp. NBC_01754]WSC95311.1 SRPBCC family protein [Streptomyces sp. NBC_01754]